VVVKATKVDGIYDKDPKKHSDAVRHDSLYMHEVLSRDIRVMDQSAIAMAKDEEMPIYVCRIEDIDKITTEDIVGTFVYSKA
jgi:uridylate kinase